MKSSIDLELPSFTQASSSLGDTGLFKERHGCVRVGDEFQMPKRVPYEVANSRVSQKVLCGARCVQDRDSIKKNRRGTSKFVVALQRCPVAHLNTTNRRSRDFKSGAFRFERRPQYADQLCIDSISDKRTHLSAGKTLRPVLYDA